MKGTPFKLKQNLSPVAKKAKAERDLAAANTSKRSTFRAESQMERRKKSSSFLKGKDYDHHTGSFVSSSKNRGGMGKTGNTTNE
tara:strand:- start:331 stop:582 length:252 start_codon:yes stop_codon:yes gene_type:complete